MAFWRKSRTNGIESNVEETFSDSSGSFRKTTVMPFCFEKTRTTNPESLKSERVICRGIVSGVLYAAIFVSDHVGKRVEVNKRNECALSK